jgi:hypothetical protein
MVVVGQRKIEKAAKALILVEHIVTIQNDDACGASSVLTGNHSAGPRDRRAPLTSHDPMAWHRTHPWDIMGPRDVPWDPKNPTPWDIMVHGNTWDISSI